MPKTRMVPIQQTNPDGSVSIISSKQLDLFHFFKEVEEVPPKMTKDSENILELGSFQGIEFRMFAIDDQYWCMRISLEEIYPNIRDQFSKLCRDYVEEFDCYWLEENVDFIYINRKKFEEKFGVGKTDAKQKGGDLVLLSVEGIIKLLSRSSKMKTVLFWLIKKFMEYRLLKFEVEKLWEKIQKTESPAETYFYIASMRHINIERLEPQVRIGTYRGDFVIDGKFLVMIKGYKYHSGKDKLYEDTKRERYIQQKGYVCITFWAYEVFHDVDKCVTETIEIMGKHRDLLKDPQKI